MINSRVFSPKQRKDLHKNRVQSPEVKFWAPTWPSFLCLGAPTWPPWRQVNQEYFNQTRPLFIGVHWCVDMSFGIWLFEAQVIDDWASLITVRFNNIYSWKSVPSPEITNAVFVLDVVVGWKRQAYATRPNGNLVIRRNFAHRRRGSLHIFIFAREALARIH